MKATELIRKLRASGTGKQKLDVAVEIVRGNPSMTALELGKALRAHAVAQNDAGFVGTIEKCRDIIELGDWQPKESVTPAEEDVIEFGEEKARAMAEERAGIDKGKKGKAEKDDGGELETLDLTPPAPEDNVTAQFVDIGTANDRPLPTAKEPPPRDILRGDRSVEEAVKHETESLTTTHKAGTQGEKPAGAGALKAQSENRGSDAAVHTAKTLGPQPPTEAKGTAPDAGPKKK